MQRLLASMGLETGDYAAQALQHQASLAGLYKAKYSIYTSCIPFSNMHVHLGQAQTIIVFLNIYILDANT